MRGATKSPCGLILGLLVGAALTSAAAQQPVKVHEEKPGLLAQAKVTPDAALATALKAVPGARLGKAGIEMEKGRLIYSFDLTVVGKPGIEEVTVDARTGKVVAVEHEDAEAEAKEEAAEMAREKPKAP
ncbi:MAG: PepSY domain-containing protein [Gemmatimonadota bacterium]